MQSSLHEELAKSSTTYAAKEANAPLEECNDEVKRQLSSSTTEQRPTKKFKNGDDSSAKAETSDSEQESEESSTMSGPQQNNNRNLDSEELDLEVEMNSDDDDEDLFRRILAAAASRGISLDFLAPHLHHHGDDSDDDDDDVEYPFPSPPQSLEDVASFLKSEKCQKILVLAGAGMSVASGIPDFRSSNGLYATLDADKLTCNFIERERIRQDKTYCLDQHLFLENPLPCLEVNREFILGVRDRKWKATLAHRFVELVNTQLPDKLCRLYTQNIDGLEDQCLGLDLSQRIAVHGSMDQAECAICKQEMGFDKFCTLVEKQIKDITGQDPWAPKESTPIRCESCGAGAVKPSIVLFRSSLPQEFFQKVPRDVEDVDLLIIMGTSLHVAPANSLVWRVPNSAMRVLINRESVGWHLGLNVDHNDRDYFGEGNCENICIDLIQHLGWIEHLKPLLYRNELPEASSLLLRERLEAASKEPKQQEGVGTEDKEETEVQNDTASI